MVYSSIVLSLSGVRKLGSTATKESLLIMRKNKFRRKVDDVDLASVSFGRIIHPPVFILIRIWSFTCNKIFCNNVL